METQNLKDDVKVFYITAKSFPEGIKEAHQKLHSLLSGADRRKFYGISYPNKQGGIVYKAAAEELFDGEAEKYGCETLIIRKGDYISETLINWRNDESRVTAIIKKLLSHPKLDGNGYCLESYINETDMICMVKLDS